MKKEEFKSPSVESDSTITLESTENNKISATKIVQMLNQALVELRETEDYLSYATLIEIYLQNKQDTFNDEEKTELLQGLYGILNKNSDIVYEIGWDLPSLLLDYLFSGWTFSYLLAETPGIITIIKIFGLISLHGNPKEIFLRSCELLNGFKFEEMEISKSSKSEYYQNEVYHKLAIHNIVELLWSSMARIKTRYPSRFLSKLIITLINFLSTNFEFLLESRLFIFRRYYVAIRDFSGLPLPDDTSDISDEDFVKTVAEENYLQRKLLTSFLTHFVSLTVIYEPFNWTYDFYSQEFHDPLSRFRLPDVDEGDLKEKSAVTNDSSKPTFEPLQVKEEENWDALLFRCATLAQSFDIDLETLFHDQIDSAKTLFSKLDHSQSMNSLNDQVYALAIDLFNKSNRLQRSIPLSDQGIFFLMTQLVNKDSNYSQKNQIFDVDTEGIVKLTLKNLIPAIIDPSIGKRPWIDANLFWSWYTIKNTPNFALEISKMDPVFIRIYLQIWIALSSVNPNASLRVIMWTLVTKILTICDENLSYDFIIESIETCPYDNAKLALVGILKDLLIRPKSLNKLSEGLGLLNLQASKEEGKNKNGPPLPPREVLTYVQLTSLRKSQLLKLFQSNLNLFFKEEKPKKDEMVIILSLLNLFIAIKGKLSKDDIKSILENVDTQVKNYKSELKRVGRKDDINIDFLTVASETLAK